VIRVVGMVLEAWLLINGDFLARSNKCRGFLSYESRAFVGDAENAAK
jgi:hypothetical protein